MGKSMAWAFTTAYRSVQHTFIRLTPHRWRTSRQHCALSSAMDIPCGIRASRSTFICIGTASAWCRSCM